MTIDEQEVGRIAWLARLAVSEQDLPGYCQDLQDILAMAAELQAVDASALQPLAHPLELSAALRPDQITEEDCRAEFQQGAPATADGYYLTPEFIE